MKKAPYFTLVLAASLVLGHAKADTLSSIAGNGTGLLYSPANGGSLSAFGTPLPVPSGFNARLHLQKFGATAAPTVCLVGDSTASYTANQIEQSELLTHVLEGRLKADNPTKTINFVNRAVPSQTWTTLNGIAVSNYPSWYVYNNLPWLPYVQAQNCTSVIVNMGINDSYTISPDQIRAVLAKMVGWGTAPALSARSTAYTVGTVITDSNGLLQEVYSAGTSAASAPAWATAYAGASTTDGSVVWVLLSPAAYVPLIPDIVLITNKVSNPLAAPTTYPGTLLAAAYQRTLARNGGSFLGITGLPPIGLLDLGAYQAALLLGYDPDNQYLQLDITDYPTTGSFHPFVATTVNGTAGYGYSFPTTQYGDFGILGTFYGRGPDMLTAAGSAWLIGVGTGTTDYIQITQTGANLTATVTDGSGGFQACPGVVVANLNGNIVWDVTLKGAALLLTINGITMCDGNYPRLQGAFAPWMQVNGSAVGSFMNANVSDYAEGVPVPTSVLLTGVQAYGSAVAGTPSPTLGGQGSVHSSSFGIAAEDAAFLNRINFSTQ
jgi:lysophospholipase L1-like esterase